MSASPTTSSSKASIDIACLYREFSVGHSNQSSANLSTQVPMAATLKPVPATLTNRLSPPAVAAAAAAGASMSKAAASQTPTGMIVLDTKEIKRVLKRTVVSTMFDLLSHHESRMYSRERWLLRRLKKTLERFERAMTTQMEKSLATAGQQKSSQEQKETTSTASVTVGLSGLSDRQLRKHSERVAGYKQAQQLRQSDNVGTESATTCVPVQDSETVGCDLRALGAKRRKQVVSNVGALAALSKCQSNCNNASCSCNSETCLIQRKLQLPAADSRSVSGETAYSVASASCSVESWPRTVFSGFNISTSASPFPRFPRNANCNHGTSQRGEQQQLLRQKPPPPSSQLIYSEVPTEETPPQPPQKPPWQSWQPPRQPQGQQKPQRVSIYSPSRPVTTRIHRSPPGVCQCRAAAGGVASPSPSAAAAQLACRGAPPRHQQVQRLYQKREARCNRCRQPPRRLHRKKPKIAPAEPACVAVKVSCGERRPPRIALCPARPGCESFSRVQLQTQPGRFITRQVLFFDGTYLFGPKRQDKGPCY